MADFTLSAKTALISGAIATASAASAFTVGSGESVLIYAPSAGEFDFSTLFIRVAASTSSVLGILVASDEFSDYTLGDYTVAVSSTSSVYIGGDGFDGSRFKQTLTSGTALVEMVCSSGASGYIEAVQAPYSVSG
jgi:hypothetical protein